MDPRFPTFIDFLTDRNLINFDILGDSAENFDNRFRIQKYVFLSGYFGLDLDYHFSIYLHGPYSPSLTDDYYELAETGCDYSEDLPDYFDSDGFYDLVYDMDSESLEAAATLLSVNKQLRDRPSLLERVTNMKSHLSKERTDGILGTLERCQLVQLN